MPVWCRKNCTITEGLEKFSSSDISRTVLSVTFSCILISLTRVELIHSATERPLIRLIAPERYFGVLWSFAA